MSSSDYWRTRFSRQHAEQELAASSKLDFSNDRVRFQTYGWLLESMGPPVGLDCLDAGCGTGEIALLLDALGGRVDAFDLAAPAVETLAAEYPRIRWFECDLAALNDCTEVGEYDLIIASEVLQYVDIARAVNALWDHLRPGGRLLGVVPNAACPIVQSAAARFKGHYNALGESELGDILNDLDQVQTFVLRGATFMDDQTLVPYALDVWRQGAGSAAKPPNRLQFVALKASNDNAS